MVDITHKNYTERTAIATAIVRVGKAETIDAIKQNKVPKGDVLQSARVAGLFAAKKTSDIIPDCHPLPIEYTNIQYELSTLEIEIIVEIKTIYKTGVEVEAMHVASVVALTMYDMLKPIDKEIEIHTIKLKEKKGGKSNYNTSASTLKIAVLVCSDSIAEGKKEDKSGQVIIEKLKKLQANVTSYTIISDDIEKIQNQILENEKNNFDLMIITGGTGVSPKDVTTEAVKPLLDKEIPGVSEHIRNYGQMRTPYSMLSRSICGFRKDMLILALPGSVSGAGESMDAVFPALFHLFKVRNFFSHDNKNIN